MDLEQVLEQSPGCPRCAAATWADLRDSDVAVLLSSSPLVAGMPGSSTSRRTPSVADEFADALARLARRRHRRHESGRPARDASEERTGLDRRRVLGYTINDSLRLRDRPREGARTTPGAASRPGSSASTATSASRCTAGSGDGRAGRPTAEQIAVADDYRRTGTRGTSRWTPGARRHGRPAWASPAWSPRLGGGRRALACLDRPRRRIRHSWRRGDRAGDHRRRRRRAHSRMRSSARTSAQPCTRRPSSCVPRSPGSRRDRSGTAPLACRHPTPRIRSAAFSPIMIVAAFVLPRVMVGMTDASATRRPSKP